MDAGWANGGNAAAAQGAWSLPALDVLDDSPEGIGPNRLARLLGMA